MAWNELGQTGLDMMSRMMGGGVSGWRMRREGRQRGGGGGTDLALACVGLKVLFKDRLGGGRGHALSHTLPLPWVSPLSPARLRMTFQIPSLPSRPSLWLLRRRKEVFLPTADSQNSAVI